MGKDEGSIANGDGIPIRREAEEVDPLGRCRRDDGKLDVEAVLEHREVATAEGLIVGVPDFAPVWRKESIQEDRFLKIPTQQAEAASFDRRKYPCVGKLAFHPIRRGVVIDRHLADARHMLTLGNKRIHFSN